MSASIMSALNGHLAQFATTENIPCAWEGVDFTPPAGAYLRAFLLPAQSRTIGVPDSSSDSHRGVFQVDAVYPAGQGWGPARTMAGKVCSHFRRKKLAGVKITDVSEGPGTQDNGRYKIPVSINYVAFSKEV
jgi:hypothetical protein